VLKTLEPGIKRKDFDRLQLSGTALISHIQFIFLDNKLIFKLKLCISFDCDLQLRGAVQLYIYYIHIKINLCSF